jgi:hypothetical protein
LADQLGDLIALYIPDERHSGEQLRLFHLIGYAQVLAGVVIASRQASAKA